MAVFVPKRMDDVQQNKSGLPSLRDILANLVLVCMGIGFLAPIIPIVIWAFSYRWLYPSILPEQIGFQAWATVFSGTSRLGEAVWNGSVIAVLATMASLMIGIPASRALGLYQFRGKHLVEFLILAPEIVPGIAFIMGIQVLFIQLGLSSTLIGVVFVHLIDTIPYVVMILTGIFANYPIEYEEQARSLGANSWQIFWNITLPAIFPGVIVAGMFSIIISWGQYLLTLFIGGGKVITVPILLLNYASGTNNPVTAVLCLVFIIPVIIYLILSSKYLMGENPALRGLLK